MYAIDFEYDGERLSDYKMIVGYFDGSNEGTMMSGANITFNQIKSDNVFRLNSSTYDECYTTTFQIIKDPCYANEPEDMYLSPVLVSKLQRWLCRKNKYCKFKVFQDEYSDLYWNATFSSQQIEYGGHIVGLEVTMYTDHPYGFVEQLSLLFQCDANSDFEFYNLSDEVGYLYPIVRIRMREDIDELVLYNYREPERVTRVFNLTNDEVIKFSGDTKIITSTITDHIAKDFNYIYPRIINDYGDNLNKFHVNKPCFVRVEYSPVRKVGL